MLTNVVTPIYAERITTSTPRISRTVGCLYPSPIMDFFLAAMRQIPKVIGRISPLNAPARTKRTAGFPRISMISVETATLQRELRELPDFRESA